VIDVINDSPRATTVREVGLYAHPVAFKVESDDGDGPSGKAHVDFPFNDQPIFMEGGSVESFAGFPDIFTQGFHVDEQLRVYAVDARGKRLWGNAAPHVRLMLGDSADGLDDLPEVARAFRDLDQPPALWPVESAWKLWKPKDQRRQTSQSRELARQEKNLGSVRIRGHVKVFDVGEKANAEEA
jgi:hypothetical protein